jgi:hypothetical protein
MSEKGERCVLENVIQGRVTQSIDDNLDNARHLSFAVLNRLWGRMNDVHFSAPFKTLVALTGISLYVVIQAEYRLI